jgi:hypothetical protein
VAIPGVITGKTLKKQDPPFRSPDARAHSTRRKTR